MLRASDRLYNSSLRDYKSRWGFHLHRKNEKYFDLLTTTERRDLSAATGDALIYTDRSSPVSRCFSVLMRSNHSRFSLAATKSSTSRWYRDYRPSKSSMDREVVARRFNCLIVECASMVVALPSIPAKRQRNCPLRREAEHRSERLFGWTTQSGWARACRWYRPFPARCLKLSISRSELRIKSIND